MVTQLSGAQKWSHQHPSLSITAKDATAQMVANRDGSSRPGWMFMPGMSLVYTFFFWIRGTRHAFSEYCLIGH